MGDEVLTNSNAAALLVDLKSRAGVLFAQDPAGIDAIFPRLGESESPDRKRCTDAYLAAFAIAGNHELISFDPGFSRHEAHGLNWTLLSVS